MPVAFRSQQSYPEFSIHVTLSHFHSLPNPMCTWQIFKALVHDKRTCFFNLITLNLSKSERLRLFSLCSLRFAHALSPHFFSTSAFSQALATAPRPAARGNFGMTIGVTMRLLSAAACRGTAAPFSFEGPSTRALLLCQVISRGVCREWPHTRL